MLLQSTQLGSTPPFVCRSKLKSTYPEKMEALTNALEEVTTRTGWRESLYANGYGELT